MALKSIKGKKHHYYDINRHGTKYLVYRKSFRLPDGRSKVLQVSENSMNEYNKDFNKNETLATYWDLRRDEERANYTDGRTRVKKLDTKVKDLSEKFKLHNSSFRQGTYLKKLSYWDNYIFDHFKERVIRSIEPLDISEFYDDLRLGKIGKDGKKKKCTWKTILEIHRVLNSFFQWMIDERMKIISEVPIAKSQITKINNAIAEEDKQKKLVEGKEIISTEDIQAIFQEVRIHAPNDEIVYHWNAMHGMRVSEALGVYWEDIDINKMEVNIQRQTAGYSKNKLNEFEHYKKDTYATIEPVKTGYSEREVPLQPATYQHLKAMNPNWDKKGLIYKTSTGSICTRDNWDKRHFKPLVNKMGIGLNRTHSLRKWFGSYQLKNGIDIATICEWMGHEDLNTFYKHYKKEIKEMRERNGDKYALISQVAI